MLEEKFECGLRVNYGFHIVFHAVHEPHGGRCCPTNAYALFACEPLAVDAGFVAYEVGVGIGIATLGKEYAPIARLAAAHKEYQLMLAGKLSDLRNAVGHGAAYSVEAAELAAWLNAFSYLLGYLLEFLE